MKIKILALLLAAFLPLPWVPGDDALPDEEDWTVITSDGNLLMDYAAQTAVFSHNVRGRNSRGSLDSNRLVIFFAEDGQTVKTVEAIGNVKVDMGGRTGGADKLLYYPQEGRTVLLGSAAVRIGEDSVRGEEITFFLDRDEIEVKTARELRIVPPQKRETPAVR